MAAAISLRASSVSAARESHPGGHHGEVTGARRRHPRTEQASTEGDGQRRVLPRAQSSSQLRQVGQDARRRQAIAEPLPKIEGALGKIERAGVITTPAGDDRQVVEREGRGAQIALPFGVVEHTLEEHLRLVRASPWTGGRCRD